MKVGSQNTEDRNISLSNVAGTTGAQSSGPEVTGFLPSERISLPEAGASERNLVDRNSLWRVGLDQTFAASTAGRFDYNTIQGVRGNRHVTQEFLAGVEAMAGRLGTRPEYLLAVMSFETGGTFNPGVRNSIGATGLIQFLPSTARGLGTTTDRLAQMSSTEQLRYVERYFDQPHFRGRLGSLEGLYTAVLSGRARAGSDDVLFTRGTRAYEQNPLDWNQDGRITAGEAVTPVAARMYGGVRAVQQRLVDAGFVPAAQQRNFADGTWGRNTAAAVRRFQEANDLPPTGLMDDRTGRALFGLRPPTADPTVPTPGSPAPNDQVLERGSRGARVAALQDQLVELGLLTRAQKATGPGIFGPQTERALEAFQRRAHLPANGRLTPETARAMREIELSLGRTTAVRNESVTKGLQDRLIALGYMTRAEVDTGYGTFGPRTEAAIRNFQQRNGVEPTGRVGELTYRTLFAPDARPAPRAGTPAYSEATDGRHYTVARGILMTDELRPRIETLAERYAARTGETLHVTSGYRPPARQAAAMHGLIAAHGTAYVRNLYADKTAVDQILTAYGNHRGNRDAAVNAMTGVIAGQTARGVFVSDHLRSRALDVSTSADFGVLRELVAGMRGSILNEGDHFHIEL